MNSDPEQGFTISLPKRGKSMDLSALNMGLLHSGHEEDGTSGGEHAVQPCLAPVGVTGGSEQHSW